MFELFQRIQSCFVISNKIGKFSYLKLVNAQQLYALGGGGNTGGGSTGGGGGGGGGGREIFQDNINLF